MAAAKKFTKALSKKSVTHFLKQKARHQKTGQKSELP